MDHGYKCERKSQLVQVTAPIGYNMNIFKKIDGWYCHIPTVNRYYTLYFN